MHTLLISPGVKHAISGLMCEPYSEANLALTASNLWFAALLAQEHTMRRLRPLLLLALIASCWQVPAFTEAQNTTSALTTALPSLAGEK